MMRVGVDQEIVDEYAQKMLDGDKFPPVIIFNDGDKNYLVEGFKRYYAHKKNGFEIIDADTRMGTYDDAFDYAFQKANRGHGERYKTKDKRLQLKMAFELPRYAKRSDRELSRILDVSHTFVSKARKEEGKQPDVIDTTRNGKPVTVKSTKKELDNDPKQESPNPEYEFTEDDKIQEISNEMQNIVEENEKLQLRLAVAAMEATPEEKQAAQSKFDEMEAKIKALEEELRVTKISRDSFQRENAELKKQCAYWEKRTKKAETLLNKQAA
jgi:hypothetical protein